MASKKKQTPEKRYANVFKYANMSETQRFHRQARAYARGMTLCYMDNLSPAGERAAQYYLDSTNAYDNAFQALKRFYQLSTGDSRGPSGRSRSR